MTNADAWLILFDIDGTLVQTGRAGLRGMNAAFARLYGVDRALEGVPLAGRTDRAIVSDVLRGMGREPSAQEIYRLREAYVEDLAAEITRPVSDPSGILTGVEPLLDALEARRASVAVGLLTGNFERGAAIKLGRFDLWRRFAFGAFGDEHVDRRALVPVAVSRARDAGCVVSPDRVVVIGDTPLDVDCAQAYGARAVAVATGPYDRAALAATRPDLVVDTLVDGATLLEWLAES